MSLGFETKDERVSFSLSAMTTLDLAMPCVVCTLWGLTFD